MCVPDMALIVEIMLMSEGFNMSKMLSRKFVILYRLCEDLLSKSKHYDWKLRAIKTTLYVAGGMKRSAPDLSEDKVKPCLTVTCLRRNLALCQACTKAAAFHTFYFTVCMCASTDLADLTLSQTGTQLFQTCGYFSCSQSWGSCSLWAVTVWQQQATKQCVCHVA